MAGRKHADPMIERKKAGTAKRGKHRKLATGGGRGGRKRY